MATFTLNGVTFSGQNISIRNNQIIIDGQEVEPPHKAILEVRIVEGTLEHLSSDVSVSAGAVKGSVKAGTSVKCDCVGGSVDAGTSVNCGRVGGSVKAGTSVRHA